MHGQTMTTPDAMPLPARGNGLLSEQVAEQIERSIVEQELGPGDRLPSERALAVRYGVLAAVAAVRGVAGVDNQLQVYAQPGNLPELQA
jgi:hypothetical protein